MKKIFLLIFIFSLLSAISCIKAEFFEYQPANPPSGIELLKSGDDYLLLFRSENRGNSRYGGFFIFIDDDISALTENADFDGMSGSERDAFVAMAEYTLAGSPYNAGIDVRLPVLFSDNTSYTGGSVITAGGAEYTIITRLDKGGLTPGYYLTMRTYLVNADSDIIGVSAAGNVVLIAE